MFDDYIEKLWGELAEMDFEEASEAQAKHLSDPKKGYDEYLDHLDLSGIHEHHQESYLEAMWDEFDEDAVDQVYEERIDELTGYRLAMNLDQSLATKGEDKPKIKV